MFKKVGGPWANMFRTCSGLELTGSSGTSKFSWDISKFSKKAKCVVYKMMFLFFG